MYGRLYFKFIIGYHEHVLTYNSESILWRHNLFDFSSRLDFSLAYNLSSL